MNNLTLEEVEEIVRLAIKRRAVMHGSGPSADRLADVLGLSPGQVQGYVREMRDGQTGFGNRAEFRRAMLGVAIAAGVLVLFVLGNFALGAFGGRVVSPASTPVALAPSGAMPPSAPAPAPVASFVPANPIANATTEPVRVGLSDGRLALPNEDTKDTGTKLDPAVRNARRRAATGGPITMVPE